MRSDSVLIAMEACSAGAKLMAATSRIYTLMLHELHKGAFLVMCVHALEPHVRCLSDFLSSCPVCKGPQLSVGWRNAPWAHSFCTLCVQIQKEGDMSRILPDVCQIFFTFSSQLQRLGVSMRRERVNCHGLVSHLLYKLSVLMKLLPSLESLALALPHSSDLNALAGTVPSLRKLKVHASGTCNIQLGMSKACCWCAVHCFVRAFTCKHRGIRLFVVSVRCPLHIGGSTHLWRTWSRTARQRYSTVCRHCPLQLPAAGGTEAAFVLLVVSLLLVVYSSKANLVPIAARLAAANACMGSYSSCLAYQSYTQIKGALQLMSYCDQ